MNKMSRNRYNLLQVFLFLAAFCFVWFVSCKTGGSSVRGGDSDANRDIRLAEVQKDLKILEERIRENLKAVFVTLRDHKTIHGVVKRLQSVRYDAASATNMIIEWGFDTSKKEMVTISSNVFLSLKKLSDQNIEDAIIILKKLPEVPSMP